MDISFWAVLLAVLKLAGGHGLDEGLKQTLDATNYNFMQNSSTCHCFSLFSVQTCDGERNPLPDRVGGSIRADSPFMQRRQPTPVPPDAHARGLGQPVLPVLQD